MDWLESRRLLSGLGPRVTLDLPDEALLGTVLSVELGFLNPTDGATGYGPYVDLYLPAGGVSFVSASADGRPVDAQVLTFDAYGHAWSTQARDALGQPRLLSGTPGSQVVEIPLPNGGVAPGQPSSRVVVAAALNASVPIGRPLEFRAEAGFALGTDPLANPTADPSIIGAPTVSAVEPALVLVREELVTPAAMVAEGANFPFATRVTAQVAPGQTIENLDLTALLAGNRQFVRVDEARVGGALVGTTDLGTPGTTTPGGTLTRRFSTVTGTGGDDVSLVYTSYIPLNRADGAPVLDPSAPVPSQGQLQARGGWVPGGPGSTRLPFTEESPGADLAVYTAAIRPISRVVEDRGAPGPTPGDTLEHTVRFDVSDHAALMNLVITELLADGQDFDPSYLPRLVIDARSAHSETTFDPASYTVTGSGAATSVAFRVSAELARVLGDGRVLGGNVAAGGGDLPGTGLGPTTGSITFRSVLRDTFRQADPTGAAAVSAGDAIEMRSSLTADLLDPSNLAASGQAISVSASTSTIVEAGALSLAVYAVNGVLVGAGAVPKVAYGDRVTYRLLYELPTADARGLVLNAFPALPIFSAAEIGTFDPTAGPEAPAPGHARLGPSDSLTARTGVRPVLTTDAARNGVSFGYSGASDPTNAPALIDVLFTVTAGDQPARDGAILVSPANVTIGNRGGLPVDVRSTAAVSMSEPNLVVTLAAVASDNPQVWFPEPPVAFTPPGMPGYRGLGVVDSRGLAARQINRGASGFDAGDVVTFAVMIENAGTGPLGASDVRIKDRLPAGFAIPAGGMNLSVTDGTGAAFTWTDLGGGLFGQGIALANPGPTASPAGAVDPYSPDGGRNIIVVTYDLQAKGTVEPGQLIEHNPSVIGYATRPGGPNFAATPSATRAFSNAAGLALDQRLTATDRDFTQGNQLAIGEVGTVTLTLTVPEGVATGTRLSVLLPDGIALVGLDRLDASPGLASSMGAFNSILASATIGAGGSSFVLDLGDLTNPDRDPSRAETLTLLYRVVALNSEVNTSQRVVYPQASAVSGANRADGGVPLQIVTPSVRLSQSLDRPEAQANETITYTLIVTHDAGNGTPAFDVDLSDVLPDDLAYVPGSLRVAAGATPRRLDAQGNQLSLTYDALAPGESSRLTFQALARYTVAAFRPVTNSATVGYSTIPGRGGAPASAYNPLSVERTGDRSDPGGNANSLSTSATATFTPPATFVQSIVGTEEPSTTSSTVAIGEQVQYRLTVVVPQGVSLDLTLADLLTEGLALVSLDALDVSDGVSTTRAGGLAGALSEARAAVPPGGRSFALDLGTIVNLDADPSTTETVSLTFTAAVLNALDNQTGRRLGSSATLNLAGQARRADAPEVEVVVPVLQLSRTSTAASGDAGGAPVEYTLRIEHTTGSAATAFDVALDELFPTGLAVLPGTLRVVSGSAPDELISSDQGVRVRFDRLPLGSFSVIAFQAAPNSASTPGQTLNPVATLQYSTLPGSLNSTRSPYNPLAAERTGNPSDPGSSVNNLNASAGDSVSVHTNQVGGLVFLDANGNGLRDPGETPIAGASVLLQGLDNLGISVSGAAVTDASGRYRFEGLRPSGSGGYTLTLSDANGMLPGVGLPGSPFVAAPGAPGLLTVLTIPLGQNPPGDGYDLAALPPGSIRVSIFDDRDNDGALQPGESGLAGVSVRLTGRDSFGRSVDRSTLTDVLGQYDFGNLYPSDSAGYSIRFDRPSKYLDGKISAGNSTGTPGIQSVTGIALEAGGAVAGTSFAVLAPASVGGSIFIDRNGDGLIDAGEPGLGGVSVTLNGTDDLGATIRRTTSTSSDGVYRFDGLRPGVYEVVEDQPADRVDGLDTAGDAGGLADVKNAIRDIMLGPGVEGRGYAFAERATSELGIAVDVDDTAPNVGQTIRFVARLDNAGPDLATGLLVGFVLLDGLTLVSTDSTQGTYDPFRKAWSIDALDVGGSATLTLVARVESPVPLRIETSVSADQSDQTTADRSSASSVTPRKADLALDATVNNLRPNVGETVSYRLVLSNTGPDSARNAVIAVAIPDGLELIDATPDAGTFTPASGLWTLDERATGSLASLELRLRVTAPEPSSVTARISSADEYDPEPAQNAAEVRVIPRLADLELTAIVDRPTPNVGDLVTYTLTLDNRGPDSARNVTIQVAIPSGLGDYLAEASGGTFDASTGLWRIDELPAGTTLTLDLVGTIDGPDRLAIRGEILAADEYDPKPGDRTTDARIVPRQADVSLNAVASNSRPNVGETFSYRLTVANSGPDSARNLRVGVVIPNGLEIVDATSDPGTFDPAAGHWTLDELPVDADATLELSLRVNGPQAGAIEAGIQKIDEFDPKPGSNASRTEVEPRQADLALEAVLSNPRPDVGERVSYRLIVKNAGPDAARNVRVAVTIPPEFTEVVAEASGGSIDRMTGGWLLEELAAGTETTLVLTGVIASPDALTVTAEVVSADEYDPSLSDHSDGFTARPLTADLALTATLSESSPTVGQTVNLVVRLENRGPDDARNATIRVSLPEGFEVSSSGALPDGYDGQTGLWTVGRLAAGEVATLTIPVVVTEGAQQTLEVALYSTGTYDLSRDDEPIRITTTPLTPPAQEAQVTSPAVDLTPAAIVGPMSSPPAASGGGSSSGKGSGRPASGQSLRTRMGLGRGKSSSPKLSPAIVVAIPPGIGNPGNSNPAPRNPNAGKGGNAGGGGAPARGALPAVAAPPTPSSGSFASMARGNNTGMTVATLKVQPKNNGAVGTALKVVTVIQAQRVWDRGPRTHRNESRRRFR